MSRERKGSIVKRKDGSLFARVTFVDSTGKRKDKLKRADNRTHAKDLIKEMLREVDDNGEQSLDAKKMTFADLAKHYEDHYLTEAKYKNGKKESGLRSLNTPKRFLKTLTARFGRKRLRELTYGDVRAYRVVRLETKTRHDKERSITSVNRELALLRRMFNIAKREGWLLKNPMSDGESLVKASDERTRERVLSFAEENRLLTACGERTYTYKRRDKHTGEVKDVTARDSGEKRRHLKAIIIAAIDTGCRKAELLKLKWQDVDFDNRAINVQAFNTKTMKARTVGMSTRLMLELEILFNQSPQHLNALVFGMNDVKKSFEGARHDAGLDDVRFHDLRHTHATRLVAAHIPITEIARQLGHQQLSTTYRYTNQTTEATKRITDVIDALDTLRAGAVQDEADQNSLIN